MFMSIDATPARLLRVVQVKDLDPIESDGAIELAERVGISVFGAEIVAGRQQVTGVQADPDPG